MGGLQGIFDIGGRGAEYCCVQSLPKFFHRSLVFLAYEIEGSVVNEGPPPTLHAEGAASEPRFEQQLPPPRPRHARGTGRVCTRTPERPYRVVCSLDKLYK